MEKRFIINQSIEVMMNIIGSYSNESALRSGQSRVRKLSTTHGFSDFHSVA